MELPTGRHSNRFRVRERKHRSRATGTKSGRSMGWFSGRLLFSTKGEILAEYNNICYIRADGVRSELQALGGWNAYEWARTQRGEVAEALDSTAGGGEAGGHAGVPFHVGAWPPRFAIQSGAEGCGGPSGSA